MQSKYETRKGFEAMKRITLALVIAAGAICTNAKPAAAQEILLEGPLAGAPAVHKLVQYRKMRFSAGPQFGYTILNDYMHNFLLGLRLEFNVMDWLGFGVLGYYGVNAPTKLTSHISDSRDLAGNRTVPSESNWPSYTGADNFEDQVALLKGMYLAQISLVPFRGKLALFERLFVAVDGYIFLGGGIVHFEQRDMCSSDRDGGDADWCGEWDDPDTWSLSRSSRIGGTFTAGVGFMVYFNDWFGVNLEYRLAPFKWNAGGTDEAGSAGARWRETDEHGQLEWETVSRGRGDYPDGNIDDRDMSWNSNQSIAIGFIFHFPFETTISD